MRRRLLYFSFYAVSILNFFGCASTQFSLPTNRFITPEAGGALAVTDLKINGVGSTDIQLAVDLTAAAPDTTPKLQKSSTAMLGLDFGLRNKFDVYVNGGTSTPISAGIKYQLLGDGAATAKAGNFSLALAVGGYMGSSKSEVTLGTVQGQAEINYGGYEALLLMGYRPTDSLLIYGGPFQAKIETKAAIHRTSSSVITTTATPDGTGTMSGLAVGLRSGKNYFAGIEVAMTKADWTRTNPSELKAETFNDVTVGITFGKTFGHSSSKNVSKPGKTRDAPRRSRN